MSGVFYLFIFIPAFKEGEEGIMLPFLFMNLTIISGEVQKLSLENPRLEMIQSWIFQEGDVVQGLGGRAMAVCKKNARTPQEGGTGGSGGGNDVLKQREDEGNKEGWLLPAFLEGKPGMVGVV